MGLGAEALEIRCVPQHGVNGLVVGGAVPVVLGGGEDGAQVEGLHPQTGQIVQLFGDSRQGPAKKVPVVPFLSLGREVYRAVQRGLEPVLVDQPPAHGSGGVRDAGAVKAVREDLVAQSVPKPARHRVGPVVDSELIGSQLPYPAPEGLQTEGIPDQPHVVSGVQSTGEGVPVKVSVGPGHGAFQDPVSGLFQPGGEHTAGKTLCPAGAEGKVDRGAGGHRSVGRFVPAVPGVVNRGVCHRASSSHCALLRRIRPAGAKKIRFVFTDGMRASKIPPGPQEPP